MGRLLISGCAAQQSGWRSPAAREPAHQPSGGSGGWGVGGPALAGSAEKPAEMQGRNWDRQGGDTEAKVRLLKWGHPGSHKVTF